MNDAAQNPTRTFKIDAPKQPELAGLVVTVRPNNGPLMREVGALAKRRRIKINLGNLSPDEAIENALLTTELLVVRCYRQGKDGAADEVLVPEGIAPGIGRTLLKPLIERYDSFAKLIRDEGDALQTKIEGGCEVAAGD